MEKKNAIAYLSSMEGDIAEVIVKDEGIEKSLLVFLVSEPSNDDLIIPSEHWNIYDDIDQFMMSGYYNDPDTEIISINEFVSDFKRPQPQKEIDPDIKDNKIELSVNHGKTIRWHKVKCSFFKQEIGVKKWSDLIDFMSRFIGFDYTITGQYTEPYTGVEGYYEDGEIHKL